jgi:hypothetical protein
MGHDDTEPIWWKKKKKKMMLRQHDVTKTKTKQLGKRLQSLKVS